MGTEPSLIALIEAAESGSKQAAEALFAALYTELHHVARRQLASIGMYATLGTTSLLHQAYIEMAERDGVRFPDEARFMGYAARVMRGLVIDYVRNRHAQKRGGQFEFTSLAGNALESSADETQLRHISDALDQLSESDSLLAEIVDLHFFCGFTFAEIAAIKKISERTAQRHWEKARIYLHRTIRAELEA